MTFVAKFKKDNSKIAASSVKTYLANIKRLAKLAGKSSIPDKGAWIMKSTLVAKVRGLPLGQRKLLSLAALKASKSYGQNAPAWVKMMEKSSKDYQSNRNKREKTEKEKKLWVDYDSVHKAGVAMWKKVPQDAKKWSVKQFHFAQKAYLLLLYGIHTPRLLESLKLPGVKGPNQLLKTKGGFKIVLREYKTAKSRGPSVFALDKRLTGPTKTFVEGSAMQSETGFVFLNARGKQLSKTSFSKLLTSAMRAGGLKGATNQLLRVFKATKNRDIITKAKEIEDEMGHGSKQNLQYSKK